MRIHTIISVGGKAVGRKRRNRSTAAAPPEKRPSCFRRHAFWLGIAVFAVAAISAARYLPGKGNGEQQMAAMPSAPAPDPIPPTAQKAFTLDKLLAMPVEQLADVDIAEMNRLCAKGLPGAESLDIAKCMARLDEWAAHVQEETERHVYRAHDPQWANHYKHSENWLRTEMLAQVLQEDCGIHYNMERIRNIDFRNAKDLFIHGMIGDPNGGTCASMPVLYTAVGRRLGYPLKLVTTRGHVFVRWDDGRERFNIETTSNGGTDSYPDEHYREWPEKLTDAEVKRGHYLVSLSPAEELATSLAARGHCLLDNGHPKEAFDAYSAAHRLAPETPVYLAWAQETRAKLNPAVAGRQPARLRVPIVYRNTDPLAEIERINAIKRANMQRTQPQMPGVPQSSTPYGPQPPDPHRPQPYGPPPVPGSGQR